MINKFNFMIKNLFKERPYFIVEITIGSIVTSALLAVWLISYLSPLLTAKNELALINAEIAEANSERQRLKNEQLLEDINTTRFSLEMKIKETIDLNNSISNQQSQFEKQLRNITANHGDSEDKYQELILINNKHKKRAEGIIADLNPLKSNDFLDNGMSGMWFEIGVDEPGRKYRRFLSNGTVDLLSLDTNKIHLLENVEWKSDSNNIFVIDYLETKVGNIIGDSVFGVSINKSSNQIKPWVMYRLPNGSRAPNYFQKTFYYPLYDKHTKGFIEDRQVKKYIE